MWHLPFVSRERFNEARADAAAWAARYDALRAEYAATVKELTTKPVAVSQNVSRETAPADPVLAAIAARAGNSGPTRRLLGAFVARERAKGTPDARIIERIEDWTISDDDEDREAAIAQHRATEARQRAAVDALAFELTQDEDEGIPEGL